MSETFKPIVSTVQFDEHWKRLFLDGRIAAGDSINIYPTCHPDEPEMIVHYHPEGFLILSCAVCSKDVARIEVGRAFK